MKKQKLLSFLMFLATFIAGTGRALAQVEPQISTDETVYEYYMTSVSNVQLQVYSDNDANTLGFGSNSDRAKVKIVKAGQDDNGDYYHIYVTNYEGHTDAAGASGTADGDFITYGGANNTWRKKQRSGDTDAYYFTLTNNDNVAFTAYGSKKIGLYNYTGDNTDNQAYRWKFWPANANALGENIDITSGYYKIKSKANGYYLKNDYAQDATNITYQQTPPNPITNNFIWKVNVDDIDFSVTNGQGTPVKVGSTTYPAMSVLAKMAERTYVFSNYLNRSANGDNTHIFTYSQGGTTEENQWVFEPVTTGTAYRVEAPEGVMVTYTVGGVKNKAFNGGFFMCESTPAVTDFKIEADDGYGTNVVVDATNHIIKVRCTIIPNEAAIYVIKNKGTNRFAEYRDETPLRYTDNSGLICEQGMFFKITGDSINGYTIRVAKDLSQYVYNNNNSEVGVTTTDGDNCKWIISKQGDGWNINPMAGGGSSWNVNTSGEKIAYWSGHDTHNNNIWYLTTAVQYASANSPEESIVIGSFTGHHDAAVAAAEALTANFNATNYEEYEHEFGGRLVTPVVNGWYKIKNKSLNKYLFSESNGNPKNITYLNDGGGDNNSKYYWYVTFDNGQATVIGTTGLSMARGSGSATYSDNETSAVYLSPISLQAAPGDNAPWTEGYFVFPSTHSTNQNKFTIGNAGYNTDTNPLFLTTWNGTGTGNQYTFEPVTVDASQIYNVVINSEKLEEGAAAPTLTYNNNAYTGNKTVYNGGVFILSSAPGAEDFTAQAYPYTTSTITVEGNTIKVTYSRTSHVRRESMPLPGNTYMIFNASTYSDWDGMVYYDGGFKVKSGEMPSAMTGTITDSYKWKVTKDATGYKLYSATNLNTSIAANGELNGENIVFDQYNLALNKCGNDVDVLLENERTVVDGNATGAEHRVFTIRNQQNSHGWAVVGGALTGRDNGFFPFAFYTTYKYTDDQWVLYKTAKALIDKEGLIGCPKADNEHGIAIRELLLQDPATGGWATNLASHIKEYEAVTDVVKPTASGWYKIKNNLLQKYLFSESNNNPKNVTYINDGGDNSKYYWHVTFDNGKATVIGTTGLSIARGGQNQKYSGVNTTYLSPVALQAAVKDTVSWTEGYFLFPNTHSTAQSAYTRKDAAYDSATNPYFLTAWTSSAAENQYTFEPVAVDASQIYTVTIAHEKATDTMLSLTYNNDSYTGNKTVYNGGVYILGEAPAPADFTAAEAEGFVADVKVDADAKTITVYYGPKEGVHYEFVCIGGVGAAGKRMYTDGDDLLWGSSNGSNQYYWTLTAVDGGFKVKNPYGNYITHAGSDLKMGAEGATVVFSPIPGTYQWKINVGGQADCHANNHGSQSSNVICHNAGVNSASAWKLVPVLGEMDEYSVTASDGGVVTHTATGSKAMNGGYIALPGGTEVSKSSFTAAFGRNMAEFTYDADAKTITVGAKEQLKPSTVENDYYLLRALSGGYNYYLYHDRGVVDKDYGNSIMIGREYFEYNSCFKIEKQPDGYYTFRLAAPDPSIEPKYVAWINETKDGVEHNYAYACAAEDGLEDKHKWEVVPIKMSGADTIYNIVPKGSTQFLGLHLNLYTSYMMAEKGDNTYFQWTIKKATDIELAQAALLTKLHNQQSNCLDNLFTQKKSYTLSSNADHNDFNTTKDGAGIGALEDRNRATFFHSAYLNCPHDDAHYIQADFEKEVGDFCFYYFRRINNTSNRPTKIEVWASTDKTTWGTTSELLTTLTKDDLSPANLPTEERDEIYLSNALAGGNYKSLRFVVKETNSGAKQDGKTHPFFTMAEFDIFNVPAALMAYQTVLRDVYPSIFEDVLATNDPEALKAQTEALKDAVKLQTTTVIPTERATTLDPTKVYLICNETHSNNAGDLRGFICYDTQNNKVAWTKGTKKNFSTSDMNYLWRVEEDGDSYKLIPYGASQTDATVHVNAQGNKASDAERVKIVNYVDNPKKCGDGWVKVYQADEETLILPSKVTATDNLWAIHEVTDDEENMHGWNGNADGFVTATDDFEPFAFYEVVGMDAFTLMFKQIAEETLEGMQNDKVGYPSKGDEYYDRSEFFLNHVLTGADMTSASWAETVRDSLNSFYEKQELNMPVDGKAYNIISKNRDGSRHYLNYTAGGYELKPYAEGDVIPGTGALICRKVKVGDEYKYAFVNSEGKYLMWRGNNTGNNDGKGYNDVYDATNANSNTLITLGKMNYDTDHQVHDLYFLGALTMQGNRGDGGTPNYFVATSTGKFGMGAVSKEDATEASATEMIYTLSRSSAFMLKEAADPRNPVKLNVKLNDENCYVATYSAPFTTVLDENTKVKAFVATEKTTDPNSSETVITLARLAGGITGNTIIPANTGVLLSSDEPIAVVDFMEMKPATTEVIATDYEDVLETNMFRSTGGAGTAVPSDVLAYILANKTQGVGFYHLSTTGNRTLAANRAYLELGTEPAGGGSTRRVRLSFGDLVTDINQVESFTAAHPIYDLSGRRVTKPMKGGMYIRNGVKYIHK